MGWVKKSKNELKLNKFPSTQKMKNLYFEWFWMKQKAEFE